MKTTMIVALTGQTTATTGLFTLGSLPSASSEEAGAWLLWGGISLFGTLFAVAANWVIIRNRNKAIDIAQPLIVEFRKDLATKDDVAKAKAFTGRVARETAGIISKLQDLMRDENRRLYDKLDVVEKAAAEHTADIANLRDRFYHTQS
jgi:hypothetical protein